MTNQEAETLAIIKTSIVLMPDPERTECCKLITELKAILKDRGAVGVMAVAVIGAEMQAEVFPLIGENLVKEKMKGEAK